MSQNPNQGTDDDEALKMAVILFIIALIIFALIMAFMEEFNALMGAVSWFHVAPFAYAARALPILLEIPFLGSWLFAPAESVESFLARGGFAQMGPNEAGHDERNLVLTAAGRAASILYAPAFTTIALKGYEFRPDHAYRQRHSLESMITRQGDIWMTTRMFRRVNPFNMPDIDARKISDRVNKQITDASRIPPGKLLSRKAVDIRPDTWNRSLRPEEMLLAKGVTFDPVRYNELMKAKRPTLVDFEFRENWESIDLETAWEILAEQLRTPWTGPMDLKPHLRALFAVMALFYAYRTGEGHDLLDDLGILADACRGKSGKMDAAIAAEEGLLARIDGICKGDTGAALAEKGDIHAWVESAFPTFLYFARKNRGVLPSALFLWLKVEDRLMWYILSQLGSEAIMVEASGALAHNRAEAQIGKPIHRPAVYQAARGLIDEYLDMTPERIRSRHVKRENARSPGEQIDMLMAARETTQRAADEDGLDHDRDDTIKRSGR